MVHSSACNNENRLIYVDDWELIHPESIGDFHEVVDPVLLKDIVGDTYNFVDYFALKNGNETVYFKLRKSDFLPPNYCDDFIQRNADGIEQSMDRIGRQAAEIRYLNLGSDPIRRTSIAEYYLLDRKGNIFMYKFNCSFISESGRLFCLFSAPVDSGKEIEEKMLEVRSILDSVYFPSSCKGWKE